MLDADSPAVPLGTSDQADGLRRLFAGQRQRIVPLVANAHLRRSAVLLERLCSAFTELGASTLVIDAADNSPVPNELIEVDLAACIEPLGGPVHYLAARGQARRHVDPRGSSEAWLSRVSSVAPRVDVVLLHANARDLARLLGRRAARPVVMGAVLPDSLTDAYASMKLLSQRSGLMSFDLMMAADGRPSRAQALAERLATTGDTFLGTALRSYASVDCRLPLNAPLNADLLRLACEQLQHDDTEVVTPRVDAAVLARREPVAVPPVLSSLLY